MATKLCVCVAVAAVYTCIVQSVLADDSLVPDLIKRIESLERKGAQQAWQLQQQTAEIDQLRSVVKDQNEKIWRQERMIKANNRRLNHARHTSRNKARPGTVLPEQDIQPGLRRAGPVAFHAVLQIHNITKLQVGEVVRFPHVQTNVGDGYNVSSGVFTAPVAGIYIFSLTLEAEPHIYVEVSIMKDGAALAYAFASGYGGDDVYDQGSVTVVTQLAPGSQVWPSVFNPPGTQLYGEGFSSFMGCLVTELA